MFFQADHIYRLYVIPPGRIFENTCNVDKKHVAQVGESRLFLKHSLQKNPRMFDLFTQWSKTKYIKVTGFRFERDSFLGAASKQ